VSKPDRKHCWYCGCRFETPPEPGYWPAMRTRDHVIPRSKLTKGSPALTVPCCLRCNLAKGDKSVEEFRQTTPFRMRGGLFYGEAVGERVRERYGFNSLMADRLIEAGLAGEKDGTR
jgi:5-methylcytosine-specific restriction endonuclease McrA